MTRHKKPFYKCNLHFQSGGFIRIPYAIGYAGGLFLDLVAKITNRKFSVSAIRIKKFCSNTHFSLSKIKDTGFVPSYSLQEALRRTIHFEFLSGNQKDKTVFYTE